MGRIVGIDLGTTNSLVAYMDGDTPRIIPDPEGHRLVPSVVSFTQEGILVGEQAKTRKSGDAAQTVFSVKRLMGRGIRDVKAEIPLLPYHITPDSQEIIKVQVSDQQLTPPEISAIILRRLKEQAEAFLGEPVTQAVITVPAHFDDSQRQATRDAGRIAGLDVLRIINEPTAASLAYGLDKQREGLIAVYDLGGGTFDISILKLKDGVFQVLASNGDSHLGGDDFDQALMSDILEEIQEAHGHDIHRDSNLLEQVRQACEQAKRELSDMQETTIHVSLPCRQAGLPEAGTTHQRILKRAEMEDLLHPLVERTLPPCRRAMKDAGLKPEDLDEVILVGGSTRIPLVRHRVEAVFKKKPHAELNPDEVVALGAAVQAHVLAGERQDILLLDVTPLSLGIETFGGVMSRIIERNTPIPTSVSEIFTTYVDGQTIVNIHVLQGERELVHDNRSLARFQLTDMEPLPAGIPKIQVTFTIDANGILHVGARDERTGREQAVQVKPTYGLSEKEVTRMVRDAMSHAEEDIHARQLIDSRNEAETVIRSTEQALAGYRHLISDKEAQRIQEALEGLKASVAGEDFQRIRRNTRSLDEATRELAERMMQQTLDVDIKQKKIQEIL